jgi:hypothetical protein
MKQYIKTYGGMVVSEGTHRYQDLIPRFSRIAGIERHELGREIISFYKGYGPGYQEYLLAEYIIPELEAMAPEGYYFSTCTGDGACFGFFKEEMTDEN